METLNLVLGNPKGCLRPPVFKQPLDISLKMPVIPTKPMPEVDTVPTGRLNGVARPWDYRGGFVRAPLIEIVFNNRLTKQARLLWLWLAAVHPSSHGISWADCEKVMCCATKARRSCLAQLVDEGFVTIEDNGTVTMHDPYAAYNSARDEIIPRINLDFDYNEQQNFSEKTESIAEEPQENVNNEIVPEQKVKKVQTNRFEMVTNVIVCWNTYKPKSYSKIRTLSAKQLEAVNKHLKNLGEKQSRVCNLIQSVCKGIEKSDFWSNKIDQSGRTFSAVFGYGNPQDIKLKNVENLFILGQDDPEAALQPESFLQEDQDLIRIHKYISFEYEKACNRNNETDIERWKGELDTINDQLNNNHISTESTNDSPILYTKSR